MNENEIHDFHGPYQIHVHVDGHVIVFLKGQGAYSLDSDRLSEKVNQKIQTLELELKKWEHLKDRITGDA